MVAGNLLFRNKIVKAFLGVSFLAITCCCGFAESLIVVPLYTIPRSAISSVESIDEIKVIPVEASPYLLIAHSVKGTLETRTNCFLLTYKNSR